MGAQFVPLNFLPTLYGAFHQLIRADYPVVQVAAPLNPFFETFGGDPSSPGTQLLQIAPPNWNRVLFLSSDDCRVIQLQPDRMYFNWRRRPDNPDYPHYDRLRDSFAAAFDKLRVLAETENLGEIAINQCDLLYVNSLTAPQAAAADGRTPEECFRVWRPQPGPEWSQSADDLAFNIRYRLNDYGGLPVGRVTAACTTARNVNDALMIRLEMAARGRPLEPGLPGAQAFHDIGHEAIVRCFAAITSPKMHDEWGRYQ